LSAASFGHATPMLHITPEAGLAIRKLVEAQGAAADGGLRVEAREGEPAFDMSVAALPDETDLVITEETTGAKVVLDSLTADYVEDKTLDVSDTVESTVRFELTTQGVSNTD
jgi:Fe-S cluster assembly iron-binding protein IscA